MHTAHWCSPRARHSEPKSYFLMFCEWCQAVLYQRYWSFRFHINPLRPAQLLINLLNQIIIRQCNARQLLVQFCLQRRWVDERSRFPCRLDEVHAQPACRAGQNRTLRDSVWSYHALILYVIFIVALTENIRPLFSDFKVLLPSIRLKQKSKPTKLQQSFSNSQMHNKK